MTVSGVTGRGTAGVNLPALRSHNAALVLDLLRGAGAEGISRLELAEWTGLTPQAVSKITARLRQQGLAAEAGRRASTGGKPRTVLRLVPEAGHAVGVHVERDELRLVVVDLNGTVTGERRGPLNLGAGAESVVATVAREVEGLVGEALGAERRRPGRPRPRELAPGPPTSGPSSESGWRCPDRLTIGGGAASGDRVSGVGRVSVAGRARAAARGAGRGRQGHERGGAWVGGRGGGPFVRVPPPRNRARGRAGDRRERAPRGADRGG